MLFYVDSMLPLTQYVCFKRIAKTLPFSPIIFDFIFKKIFPEKFKSQPPRNGLFLGF